MKHLILLAAALYPRSWRERYGAEFRALLGDLKPGMPDLFNVLGGALQMQLTSGTAWKLVGAMTLAGALVAALVSYLAPIRYVTSATLQMTPPPNSRATYPDDAAYRLNEIREEQFSRTTLEGLILDRSLDLYKSERSRLPMENVVTLMRERDLRIAWSRMPPPGGGGPTPVLSLSFTYPDRAKSQAVLGRLVGSMIQLNVVEARMRDGLWRKVLSAPAPPDGNLIVIASPTQSEAPVGAIRATYIAWGLGGGVLLGVLTALTVRSPRYTLQMISFALVAGMLAAAVAYRLPAKFTSTAVMRISRAQLPFHSTDPAPPLPTVQRFEQLKSAVLSDANLRRIVLMPDLDLYRDERGGKPISGIVSQMRSRDISIVPASSSGLPANTAPDFLIRFTYPDKRKAQRVVMRLVRGFVDANLADERTLYSETNDETVRAILDRKVGETLVVLDPPSDPQMPVGPPRLYIALAGIGVGLLLGVLLLRKRGPSEPVPQPA